jgi:hypothetical protein
MIIIGLHPFRGMTENEKVISLRKHLAMTLEIMIYTYKYKYINIIFKK